MSNPMQFMGMMDQMLNACPVVEKYEQLLSEEQIVDIEEIVKHQRWIIADGVDFPGDGKYMNVHDVYYHGFWYTDDERIKLICNDILKALNDGKEPTAIQRIKINCTFPTDEVTEFQYHVDEHAASPDIKSAVYYVNTCDGYTRLKDVQETFPSVSGSAIKFAQDTEHKGTTSTKVPRYVINLNFIP